MTREEVEAIALALPAATKVIINPNDVAVVTAKGTTPAAVSSESICPQ